MPTAYGATAIDKKMGLRNYALMCTRAIDVCASLRDEPLSTPIPEKFEAKNDVNLVYHTKILAEDRQELERLLAMTEHEKIVFGQASLVKDRKERQDLLDETLKTNLYFTTLKTEAETWEPPTEKHTGLKKFMLEQIVLNIDSTDYQEKELAKALSATAMDYYDEAVHTAQYGIGYHQDRLKEKIERNNTTDYRNEWLKDLRDSLPKE